MGFFRDTNRTGLAEQSHVADTGFYLVSLFDPSQYFGGREQFALFSGFRQAEILEEELLFNRNLIDITFYVPVP